MTLQEILNEVLDNGVEIRMFKEKDVVKYDVNTGTKSHLYLSETTNGILAEMRYNESSYVEDFDHLVSLVLGCMCGRDYVSSYWMEVFIKKGYYRREVKTETVYTRK